MAAHEVGPYAEALEDKYSNDVVDLHRNFHSRILIASELKKSNIPNRWDAILESFDGDLNKLNIECDRLTDEIVQIGRKI